MIPSTKDIIEFRLMGHRYDSIFPTGTVEIYINNENFGHKVRDVELPFAEAEDSPMLAGHSYIKPGELYNSLHDAYLQFGSVSIFGSCGGDFWPLKVSIRVDENVVIWNDFNNSDREKWDYSKLGRFVFDKKQYFQEIDKLLKLEKQGQEIVEKFRVSFSIHDYGWATMHMCLDGKRCLARLSYLFSPFDDFFTMLKKLEKGSLYEEVRINEEGLFTVIKISAKELDDMLNITVIQENAYDLPNNYYCCTVVRSNFIQSFKWAFQMLEDDGFSPNHWDENNEINFMPEKHRNISQYDRWEEYALEAVLCDDEQQQDAFCDEACKIDCGRMLMQQNMGDSEDK